MYPPSQSKRKRSKVACEPCRERKRKCDGKHPCNTCQDREYECFYKSHWSDSSLPRTETSNHIITRTISSRITPPISITPPNSSQEHELLRSLEANSGARFFRNISLRVDPTNTPKSSFLGWNIGTRRIPSNPEFVPALSIIAITPLHEMSAFAHTYFAKIDPCYGFIDRQQFFRRLEERWQSRPVKDPYDCVLAGVAALGSLFSQKTITTTETDLVQSMKYSLDCGMHQKPSVELVTGWILRVIYLRMAGSPHSAWLASSTLVHLVEAAGLLSQPTDPIPSQDTPCDPDLRARLVGLALHLNTWISFDLGLTRVALPNTLQHMLKERPGNFTTEILCLLPIVVRLDPGMMQSKEDLQDMFSQILDRDHKQPPSVLGQCNLVLCILRRLHPSITDYPSDLSIRILNLLQRGLSAAQTLTLDGCPWHHIANVPFQTLCILLAFDTRESLRLIPEAIQVLKLVATVYETEAMQKAYNSSLLIISLHRCRRTEGLVVFNEILHESDGQWAYGVNSPSQEPWPSLEQAAWLESLMSDIPGINTVS